MDGSGVRRVFTIDDQRDFAMLSGDSNPLHIDPLFARRSVVGGVVVHGIHAVLWALDTWAANVGGTAHLVRLEAQFLKPILVGAEAVLFCEPNSTGEVRVRLTADGVMAAKIKFLWQPGRDHASVQNTLPERGDPIKLTAEQIPTCRGEIALHLHHATGRVLFRRLLDVLPDSQVASLLASTRLVGMECPGLQSLFSELSLEANQAPVDPTFGYAVETFDGRFGLVTMVVHGPGLRGKVQAFLRPSPQEQPSCSDIRAQLVPGECDGIKALVIGGSRGIGEVFAKVLAMGGAHVLITYHRGEQEARSVVSDITAHGGRADYMPFDVTSEAPNASLAAVGPTQVYYMATPIIKKSGQRGVFSDPMFAQYCSHYVEGFARTFECVRGPGLLGVLYPSTVFLEQLPIDMVEYVAAKGAGESLCAVLQKANPKTHFLVPRLPRLATDQTASLIPEAKSAALPYVLDAVRNLRERATGSA